MSKDKDTKNIIANVSKQPRVAFFLGAAMAMGWDLDYEALDMLASQTRSLVECFDVLEAMRNERGSGRVTAALVYIGTKREREATADRVRKS